MKKFVWIVLIILAAFIAWRVIVHLKDTKATGADRGRAQMAVPVEVVEPEIGTVRDIGNFSGSLKPKSGYTLASKVSGRLTRLMVNIGDKVTRGQLLAVLDDDMYQQQLEQARAQLMVTNANVVQTRQALKTAEANWTAVKGLIEKNYATQAAMDQADTEKAAAKARSDIALAEVERANSQIRSAELQLAETAIKATWSDGSNTRLVGERFVDEGNLLSANTPILTLIDNSSVTAQIDVIERDYAKIKAGQAVQVQTDAFPERTFTGKLVRLAPVLQDASRQAKAEIDIPNPEGLLKPGMFVRVQTVYAQHNEVLTVPTAAIVQREGATGVFLADESTQTAKFVPLTPGITDKDRTEVLGAAFTGKVIVLGQAQLQDGDKIKLPDKAGKEPKPKPGGKS